MLRGNSTILSAILMVLLPVIALSSTNSNSSVSSGSSQLAVSQLGKMPLAFTENVGQWPDSVLFRADAGGATMWFTGDGAVNKFARHIPAGQDPGGPDAICFKITEQDSDTSQRATDSWIDNKTLESA